MSRIRLSVTENVLSRPDRITHDMYVDHLERLGRSWVCEQSQHIIGFASACVTDHSIWALFVHPTQEGQGAGQHLLALACDWLFTQGAPVIRLSTTPGTRADRFYQAQGWQRDGTTADGEICYLRLR
ncbi:GNAT family N-acetyltransferase [Leeia sp. IMCC25680]|uniref:GNAT family N-acetyltransferase n=2 Tax=Leeia aquatica TaxID=2725557 RepID=A0A847S6G7_9NEIS|nr:GNAT family N-acetyltransferase [Leeia aquatica]